jgi:hypothetical protein
VPPQRAAQSDRIYSSQEYSREVSELVASIETTLTSSKRRAETAATDTESAEADAQQRTYGQGRLRGGQQMAPGELKTPDVSTILNKIETLNNLSKPPATDEPTHAPQTNTQLPTPPPTYTYTSATSPPPPYTAATPTYTAATPTYISPTCTQLPTAPPPYTAATAHAFSPDLAPAAVQPLATTHEPHVPAWSPTETPVTPYEQAQGAGDDVSISPADAARLAAMPVFEHVQLAVKLDPEFRARFVALLAAIEASAGEVSLNSVVSPQTMHRIASGNNLSAAAGEPNLN